ncbi:MAG: S1-C subfamily serine protease [Verrucomicrobiales bacterium]|jgi:S1-C subfamily serine protease
MKTIKKFPFLLRTIGCAGLTYALTSPITAQNLHHLESGPQAAFEKQIEQFSRLLPDDPDAREQFRKGLEEMQKAFEADAANPSADKNAPRNFQFEWQSDGGDLGDLRMEFERMGGIFGGDMFEQFFGGGGQPLPGPGQRLPHGQRIQNWFNLDKQEPPEHSKNHPDELRKFRPVVKAAKASTVQLLSGGNQVALGTIVTENGYALTKRSELGKNPRMLEARLENGDSVSAQFIESIADYDLALVKLDAGKLQPASFSEADDLPIGSLLAAPDVTDDPAAVGILSVQERNLSPKSKGYLGIEIRPATNGVAVYSVTRDSAAAAAGLRSNDIITEIDGVSLQSPPQLIKTISGRTPDETVEISYLRNGREAKTSARLRSRAELAELSRSGYLLDRDAFDQTSKLGASVNRQRGGYPSALQHDLPLSSNQMGGPLVDLDGRIVGLNIARAGRVSTYALPASEVNEILATLQLEERDDAPSRNDAPLPLAENTDKHALREEVEIAEKAIEAAREALRSAEESARAAREALDKQ